MSDVIRVKEKTTSLSDIFRGLPALDTHATDLETFAALFPLLLYLKPKVIVEAGTYDGHFAIGAATLLPDSKVFSADVIQRTMPKELPPNLTLHFGDFEEMLKVHELGFDFGFIDSGGQGEPEVRLRHWRVAQKRVRVGGILVCHDTVARSWEGGEEIVSESVNLPGGRGMCLWERKQ